MAYDSPLAYNLPAGAANTADDHFSAQDQQLLVQIERRIDLNGATVAVTAAVYNNALVRAKSGTNTLTHAGTAGESIEFTYWNRSGSDDTVLGVTVPDGAVAAAFVDGPDNIVEVSQTFSGVSGVSATGPISSTGGTTPNISILTNSANGVPLLDGTSRYPALDGSQITNVTAGPFQDTSVVVVDSLDNTKALMFQLGAIASGNTRTVNVPDSDVDLGLVREIDLTVELTANTALTIAAHRNAFLPITVGGITVTAPAAGSFFATGANFAATDVTVDGVTVPTMQMFTIVAFGGTSITKVSS